MLRAIRRLRKENKGIATVEFAFIILPLTMIILCTIEIAYRQYVMGMVQGTLQLMARRGAFEGAKVSDLETYAKNALVKFAAPENVTVTIVNFRTFNHMGKPEKITKDVSPLGGAPGPGDCYLDEQENGNYDAAMAGNSGIGKAESVARYTLALSYTRLTPFSTFMGFGETINISRSTMVRNEPFEGVLAPPEICIPT